VWETVVIRFLASGVVLATHPVGSVRFHWTGKKLVEVSAQA